MCYRSIAATLLAFLTCVAIPTFAAEDFSAFIESSDELRQQKRFDEALKQLRSAFSHAANSTERGIALGKQAEVLSYDLNNHAEARKVANVSLALPKAGPIARVTALKVLARCQMLADEDHDAAISTLTRAAAIQGVDWAQPTILLMLGDCYRAKGKHEEAIRTYGRVTQISAAPNSVQGVAYLNAALVYQYDLHRLDRARLHYDKAAALNPALQIEVVNHLNGEERRNGAQSLILAHYMPWYTAKPFSDHWGWHWTMNHFDPEKQNDGRREIASRYYPLIGPYDSGDPFVLEYHLLLMKLAGIDGVIADWYGLHEFRDYPTLHRNTTRLLEQCERLKMKFAIC